MLTGLFEHGEVYNSDMNLSTSFFANIIGFVNEMFDRIFNFFPECTFTFYLVVMLCYL